MSVLKKDTRVKFKGREFEYASLFATLDWVKTNLKEDQVLREYIKLINDKMILVQELREHSPAINQEQVIIRNELIIPEGEPQDIGASITYLRRYGLYTLMSVCPTNEDIDELISDSGGVQLSSPAKKKEIETKKSTFKPKPSMKDFGDLQW